MDRATPETTPRTATTTTTRTTHDTTTTTRRQATGPAEPQAPNHGLNPAVLADLIRVVNAPDHPAWLVQVQRIGGCAHPLHMTGYTRRRDATGRVIENYSSADQPGGVILVPCRNRRASVCPVCAALYRGDTYALVLAGLIGGKGIPDTVTAHLRVFATLTAPGSVPSTPTAPPQAADRRRATPTHRLARMARTPPA